MLGAVTAAQQHQLVGLLAVGGGGDGAAGVVEAGRWRRQAHLDLLPLEGGGRVARGVAQVQHPQVPKGRAAATIACMHGEGLHCACWAKAVGFSCSSGAKHSRGLECGSHRTALPLLLLPALTAEDDDLVTDQSGCKWENEAQCTVWWL